MLSDGKNIVQVQQWLDKCYSDSALSETMVNRWYADFKRGCTDTNDAERSGHPNSAVDPENIKEFHELVLADRKLKLRNIAEELKISEGSVFTIFSQQESCVQIGCSVCSQLIKNNDVLTIQSVVGNCFKAAKKSFCANWDNG